MLCPVLIAVVISSCLVSLQKLRNRVEELKAKCEVMIDVGDDGSNYASLLGRLNGLRDAVRPHKMPRGWKRRRAASLKSLLEGLCTSARAHALRKSPGLAKALYAEISGHSGSPVYTRFNKALAAAEVSSGVSKSRAGSQSGPPRSSGGGERRGSSRARESGKPVTDLSIVQCYGCHRKGHYKSHCPDLKGGKA